MNSFLKNTKYFYFFLFFLNVLPLKAEKSPFSKMPDNQSQILIESNTQRSDFENSIFYAEGNVKITNTNEEFYAKSKKAIFYKADGIIKLIGDAEVITSDSNKINAGEILYFLEENKFEAISDSTQRVNTKFIFKSDNKLD